MKSLFVKICGITEKKQIDRAVELQYSAVGIVRYPQSPRYCDEKKAQELLEYAAGKIKTVAVALTLDEIGESKKYCDFIQVYEPVSGSEVIAAGETPPLSDNFAYYLYDVSRGSGGFKDFPDWLSAYKDRLIIAGGLGPENIAEVLRTVPCAGVDVSSGVERQRGIKDFELMKKFIEEVKNAQ